jgi:hypothetical protein
MQVNTLGRSRVIAVSAGHRLWWVQSASVPECDTDTISYCIKTFVKGWCSALSRRDAQGQYSTVLVCRYSTLGHVLVHGG